MLPMSLLQNMPMSWIHLLGAERLAILQDQMQPSVWSQTCLPQAVDRLKAFELSDPFAVRAVILGQDPYHGEGQAMGLAFSVRDSVAWPPSLRNILKEYANDLDLPLPLSGDLSPWAHRGVLLLNRVLTVEPGRPGSHRNHGWEALTDCIISTLSDTCAHLVFCLWGRDAQAVKPLIDERHTVLEAPHPSPLSAHRGFFGSRPFSAINQALVEAGQSPLDWSLSGDLSSDFKGYTRDLF